MLGSAPRMAAFAATMALTNVVSGLASTDTITWGGDNTRTGYQTTHNMDPDVVASDDFAQKFLTALPGTYNGATEDVFSQPLVYTTPSDGVQYVYMATTQNNVYKINAQTGTIVASRNLHIPFQEADLDGCTDIQPYIGVTSTGVIDPDTDTLYLTSKTYQLQDNGTDRQGLYNGRYYLHAINVNDLTERNNFPVALEGTVARNNPVRIFNGGIHHQRPALLHTGNYIYAGFASHCVQYNFTGWIMGWDKTTGAVVEHFATEGDGVANTTPGAGVWMSGGGLASDDKGSIFFATGNGYASQLDQIPVNGRSPPTSLEEAAVHMSIGDDGSLTVVDFFMPTEKKELDGADRDLGTSPLELLPSEFACGTVTRMGVVTGKSGKTYFLDLDNLGGYKMGTDSSDAVLGIYQNENSVYAGAGVYPAEGGYIYINVIKYPTHVFKFSCDNGVPSFTKVADSPISNSAILGVGHGTVTSLDGQAGTGLVWINDRQGDSLRIYKAIPEDGAMVLVKSFKASMGMTKFTRPVFGDGVVYHALSGGLVAYGAPTTPALNCSSAVDFGKGELGNVSTPVTITCAAKFPLTAAAASVQDADNFGISGLPTFPLTLAAGATFSFQAAFHPTSVGLLTSSIFVNTTNGNTKGYSKRTSVRVSGTGETSDPLLSVTPSAIVFNQVVTGQTSDSQSLIMQNLGNAGLSISSIHFSDGSVSQVANGTQVQFGQFTFSNLPSGIANNSQNVASVTFAPTDSGNFSAQVIVESDGGAQNLTVTASSGPAPVALLEFEAWDGSGWIEYVSGTPFTFGNVTENQTRQLKLRITNAGGVGAVPLSLTVSKPPFGGTGIIQTVNNVDLGEGVTIAAGQSATATMYCSPPKSQWNVDPYQGTASWTMNINDPNFNKQFMSFTCMAVSEQAAPLRNDGQGQYRYVGCFKENNPGRQLANQLYGNASNTNAMCIEACAEKGYAYCGTQYQVECWGGPSIPTLQVAEGDCNYFCSGDLNEICGGNGVGTDAGGAYISLFYNPNATVIGSPGAPTVNKTIGNWTYSGCFTEATTGRALADKATADDAMTLETCAAFCEGYSYFGTEYGRECYCGNTFGAGSTNTSQADCSMTCGGNGAELCGAGSRLSVYTTNSTAPVVSKPGTGSGSTTPSVNETVGTWNYQGCYTESTTGRALASSSYANDSMTLETCASFCQNYQYFGTEYGRECYCGNSLSAGSVNTTQSDCSMACSGNSAELCGAGSRLSLYSTIDYTPDPVTTTPVARPTVGTSDESYTYYGCWTEATGIRALSGAAYANDSLTLETCASFCSSFTYFGAEYGRECYCGNALNNGSIAAVEADCSFACGGNGTEVCGAGNRLSVYVRNATSPNSPSSSTTSSPAAVSTLSTPTPASTLLTFSNVSTTATATVFASTTDITSTTDIASTTDIVSTTDIASSTTDAASVTDVASSTVSLSSTSSSTTSTSATPTATVISSSNTTYTSYGCYTEATNIRALSQGTLATDDLTIEMCADYCNGYTYFGAEYGRECYCGNALNTGSVVAPDADCSFPCAGNATETCGAGNRLSVYHIKALTARSRR
ncbi:WSC-domain-containing protein [Thozetella sp. PMI_491]|nr:WSC-domain-containing protein [Thozetella sp. PMI_491]